MNQAASPDIEASLEQRRTLLRAGVVGLAVVTALIAWLATRDDGEAGEAAPVEPAPTRIVSPAQLAEAAADLGHPVYWAGTEPGSELELVELPEGGGTQVRYVPAGSEAGGEEPVLTIGSYPLANPQGALDAFAGRPGAVVRRARDGAEVVTNRESATSVYFVSPDNTVQVEVYDPSPKRSLALALSRRLRPAE